MKRTLLFLLIISSFQLQAQSFWTPKATTFSQVSRGVDDISIVDNNIIWVKAYDGASTTPQNVRQYARSMDGGNTWTSGNINLGTGQNNLTVSSLTAVSATTAWATAHPSPSGTGGVWKTIDGGTTWTKQTTAPFSTADSFTNLVYFWDANNGVVQGDPADGYFEIYTTTNGGTTWTRVPTGNIPAPLTGEYGYVHNYDVIGNTIWFGTNKGRLFKSTDKGLNWTVTQSPLSDFAGTASSGTYSFSDQDKGVILASTGALYKTTDGGITWLPVTTTGNIGNRNIEYIPGTSTIVSVGTTPNASVSYTSYSINDGVTWNEVMSGTQVTTLKFKDSELGFGGGFTITSSSGGIYKYTGTVLEADTFKSRTTPMLYPNPTSGMLTLKSENLTEIVIFDMTGKQVMSRKTTPAEHTALDVSSLSDGMYLINLVDNSGATSSLKFSKQ